MHIQIHTYLPMRTICVHIYCVHMPGDCIPDSSKWFAKNNLNEQQDIKYGFFCFLVCFGFLQKASLMYYMEGAVRNYGKGRSHLAPSTWPSLFIFAAGCLLEVNRKLPFLSLCPFILPSESRNCFTFLQLKIHYSQHFPTLHPISAFYDHFSGKLVEGESGITGLPPLN